MSKIMFHLNTLAHGGAERVVSNLSNELCESEDEIIVATEWYEDEEFVLKDKVRRIHVGLKEEDENKSRLVKAILREKYLRDAIKRENPDVVIAFAQKAIYRSLIAVRGLKNPVIVCVRIEPVGNYDKPIDKLIIALIEKRINGAVFQTTDQRDFFSKYWSRNSTVILNPANDKYFIDRKESDYDSDSKVIVQHARLVDFKNQAMLIDAFMKVREKYPDYELKIYGPDSFDGTKEILEQKIKQYNAESFIHLMGGSDEIEKQVPQAKIYAMSSDYEGMPNSLIEAMAMGMPIVATDCPCGGPLAIMGEENRGVIEACHLEAESVKTDASLDVNGTSKKEIYVGEGKLTDNGILVPIKNPDALAEGIIYLIENPDVAKYCGMHAAKSIYEQANCRAVVEQWREYIRKVIG